MTTLITSKRCVEDLDNTEFFEESKRARYLNTPRENLEDIVTGLLEHKSEAAFPQLCANVFDSDIFSIIENHSSRGGLVLPKMHKLGKALCAIIKLAVSCKKYGLASLEETRRQVDIDRFAKGGSPTRSWFALNNSDLLVDLVNTSSWESIKRSIGDHHCAAPGVAADVCELSTIGTLTQEDVTGDVDGHDVDGHDDDIQLDGAIMHCFQAHEVESIASVKMAQDFPEEYGDGWLCDLCGSSFDVGTSNLYRCRICELDFCFGCEERRINWKAT